MDRDTDHVAQPSNRNGKVENKRDGQPLLFYCRLCLAREVL